MSEGKPLYTLNGKTWTILYANDLKCLFFDCVNYWMYRIKCDEEEASVFFITLQVL